MAFLIFYYIFSVLFMIGYVDFNDISGTNAGFVILALLALLIFAPILFPINLGYAIHKI